MDNILTRIAKIAELEGINITSLEKAIGASRGVLSRALKNGSDIQSKWTQAIVENYPRYNARWLLTGEGEPLSKAVEDKEDSRSVISGAGTGKKLMPYLDANTEGGMLTVSDVSPQYRSGMMDTGDLFQDASAIMQVHGDSMYPDYKPGSLIALKEVHAKELIMFGEDYVIETSEYRVIKRLQRSEDKTCWLACSTNTDVWEQGRLKGRLIHEPYDVPVDKVKRIYLVLGEIHRKHNDRIIHSE